jgi:hypothetical protein
VGLNLVLQLAGACGSPPTWATGKFQPRPLWGARQKCYSNRDFRADAFTSFEVDSCLECDVFLDCQVPPFSATSTEVRIHPVRGPVFGEQVSAAAGAVSPIF